MATYQFTLIVEGPDLQVDDPMDALHEAGCDEAMVGRVDDSQYLDFDGEASSLEEAILTAVADVKRLGGVKVIQLADAGLVSMADIAARTDLRELAGL